MIRTMYDAISPRRVPVMSRHCYRRELATSLTFPMAVSLTEGAVAGYLAVLVFHATALQVAIITAAGMFTNLTSFLWAHLTRGRRKVPSIAVMMYGVMACVAGIAFLPTNRAGAWAFTALIIIAHTLRVGMITVRSTVWRHNYPRSQRGRLTSYLAIFVNVSLLTGPMIGSVLLEADAGLFRALHLCAAAIGTIGVASYAGIRVRGERTLLAYENRPDATPVRRGDAVGIYEYDERNTPAAGPRRFGMWAVLRRDKMYSRYMFWQFIGGVSNMMVEPALVMLAAKETAALGGAGAFVIGLALTHGLPTLLTVVTLPIWAAKLDRMHVVRFRVGQSWLWTVSQVLIWIGAIWTGEFWVAVAILAAGRIVLGAARGGGALAWNLGHNDFASREMVATYMGVHVTLTGVRGAFAPFLGMALYTGFAGIPGIGGHVFAVAAALSFVSVIGFRTLDRQLTQRGHGVPIKD